MSITEKRFRSVVVGSGAAGFASAVRLACAGVETAIVTENVNAGTSRNTGSDKQTYYKLSLAAGDADSVRAMAEDLFSGGATDGDTALCEAALSARGFYSLVELGVPFPCNVYGEYMGYKTDHDRGRRATSAGPYTSRMMTECLQRRAHEMGIPLLDRLQAIRLLVHEGRVRGVLCLDRRTDETAYVLIWCEFLVLATGGPAGMYRDSVYPLSQLGGSGMAFEAGVMGKNLTEWQFGMASLRPRWNVSGTYMQVLPRFYSTGRGGGDARDFLRDFFPADADMLSQVFLKGYQWPFDVAKIFGGSSLIDLLVYQETALRGRRVFLDFTRNPLDGPLPYGQLAAEAYAYLENAGALGGTPIDRLRVMNAPAIQFYLDHGVDLAREPLEIAVCAQHNNGGLAADANWETNIANLFAVGEVCGSHGVTRPGGSALNAGQVGALRAAACIQRRCREKAWDRPGGDGEETLRAEAAAFAALPGGADGADTCAQVWRQAAANMSAFGGMVRDRQRMRAALEKLNALVARYPHAVKRPGPGQTSLFFRLRDMLIAQTVYLAAMCDYAERGGSRGSALYTREDGRLPGPRLPELFRCLPDGGRLSGMVQETGLDGSRWRPVRPLPDVDYFFEKEWAAYRRREGLGG